MRGGGVRRAEQAPEDAGLRVPDELGSFRRNTRCVLTPNRRGTRHFVAARRSATPNPTEPTSERLGEYEGTVVPWEMSPAPAPWAPRLGPPLDREDAGMFTRRLRQAAWGCDPATSSNAARSRVDGESAPRRLERAAAADGADWANLPDAERRDSVRRQATAYLASSELQARTTLPNRVPRNGQREEGSPSRLPRP